METPRVFPKAYDEEWRKSSVSVFADLKGLLGFRQFRLTPNVSSMKFKDDFTLASIFAPNFWLPRQNVARCTARRDEHPVPSVDCSCGFYASYSSAIIYHPELLLDKLFCFGAVRMWGDDLPLAQNGLRSAGANVDGLLFRPESKGIESVRRFFHRLDEEGVFYTFSAKEFIRRFPDQSYSGLLKFDPLQRIANLTIPNQADLKTVSYKFCRPVREEMLLRHPETCRITIKPEYRPGGRLYRHPLLEVWPS